MIRKPVRGELLVVLLELVCVTTASVIKYLKPREVLCVLSVKLRDNSLDGAPAYDITAFRSSEVITVACYAGDIGYYFRRGGKSS